MVHPLDGARERLKRTEENIRNLHTEITEFMKAAPVITFDCDVEREKPILTDEHREAWDKLKDFVIDKKVAPRLSVLVGEIIHHLRSAFDHVAWQLSDPVLQTNSPHQIEFPIVRKPPSLCGLAKKKMCSYCRKIEGIASPTALARIERLQPYHGADPDRHPLWLIHDMDRIDKHRELILVVQIVQANFLANARAEGFGQIMPWEIKPRNVRIYGVSDVNVKGELSAQVTLGQFTKREDKTIIPTLQNLLSFARDAVESFAGEFR